MELSINKQTFMKLASPERHRRDAATASASSRRFVSVAMPCVIRSMMDLLTDSNAVFYMAKVTCKPSSL